MNAHAETVQGISLQALLGGLLVGWIGATTLAFLLVWLLQQLPMAEGNHFYLFMGFVVAVSLAYFYRLARARWPSGNLLLRVGFSMGTAAANYVAVAYSVFILGTLINGA